MLKKIITLLLMIVCTTSIIGCKEDEKNINTNNTEISDSNSKGKLKTLSTKNEVESFSRETLSKVQKIFTNNNIDSTLTGDSLLLYHNGSYERLGESYDVNFVIRFNPYSDETSEKEIECNYRIPIRENADILNLNLSYINALMEIMMLNDSINSQFKSTDELLKQLESDFKNETNYSDQIFSFNSSNIKSESDCLILEGYITLDSAIVKGGLVKDSVMYDFDTWDEYDNFPKEANRQVFNTMKELELIGSDEVYEDVEYDPIVKYVNKIALPEEEVYTVGMIKSDSDDFGIEYILQGEYIPYDASTNTITSTKYVDTFINLLNNSEYFKNKFDKEELMAAIYNRAQICLDNSDLYLPISISGIHSIEVRLNYEKNRLGFKVRFLSPAKVEGQTCR